MRAFLPSRPCTCFSITMISCARYVALYPALSFLSKPLKLTVRTQVPEDIQSVLSDTELFNNMPEITTKEILKRYGDLAKTPDRQYGVKPETADAPIRSPDGPGQPGAGGRPGVPVATRIETDNATQASAWQKESSVRHVQQNGAGGFSGPYALANHSSSTQQLQADFQNRNSPYHLRSGSGSSLQSQGNGTPNRHSHRPSNWGKSGTNGPLGATGAI